MLQFGRSELADECLKLSFGHAFLLIFLYLLRILFCTCCGNSLNDFFNELIFAEGWDHSGYPNFCIICHTVNIIP